MGNNDTEAQVDEDIEVFRNSVKKDSRIRDGDRFLRANTPFRLVENLNASSLGNNIEWIDASLKLLENPTSLGLYEKLVNVAEANNKKGLNKCSSNDELQLLSVSLENILEKYPLLVNYWIRYAEWKLKLGSVLEADNIYNRALIFLKYSIELWISYLKFKISTISDNLMDVLSLFEVARSKIGYHYYSYEFYDLYLSFLKNYSTAGNSFEEKYFILLRIIIEIPLYHYDYFFKLMFLHINTMQKRSIQFLVPKNDLSNFLNQDMKSSSSKLKKVFTDLYITTQYKAYQMFNFEKSISIQYFSDEGIENLELAAWENYLNFVEINYPIEYVTLIYERCLIATAKYVKFWVRYVDFLLMSKKFLAAKETLKRAVRLNNHYLIILKLVDLEIYNGNYTRARDVIISYIRLNSSVPLPVYNKLICIERLLNRDDDDYLLRIFTEVINDTQNDSFFKQILNYPIAHSALIDFFKKFEPAFKDSIIFKHSMQKLCNYNESNKDSFDEHLRQFSV